LVVIDPRRTGTRKHVSTSGSRSARTDAALLLGCAGVFAEAACARAGPLAAFTNVIYELVSSAGDSQP